MARAPIKRAAGFPSLLVSQFCIFRKGESWGWGAGGVGWHLIVYCLRFAAKIWPDEKTLAWFSLSLLLHARLAKSGLRTIRSRIFLRVLQVPSFHSFLLPRSEGCSFWRVLVRYLARRLGKMSVVIERAHLSSTRKLAQGRTQALRKLSLGDVYSKL